MLFRLPLILLFILSSFISNSADTLTVRFLYGSKPKKEHRKEQKNWFGGMLGGHVGIQYNDTSYLSFFYEGRVHIFQRKNKPSGKYELQSKEDFNYIMDKNVDSVKSLVIKIPVHDTVRLKFEKICNDYICTSPYDYAFFGYRCGSSTYEILGQLGILKAYSQKKTWKKIFYPKILRRKLIRQAKKNNWVMIRKKGTHKRIWERD